MLNCKNEQTEQNERIEWESYQIYTSFMVIHQMQLAVRKAKN